MNGSTSPHPQPESVVASQGCEGELADVDAPVLQSVKSQDWNFDNAPEPVEPKQHAAVSNADEDGSSEAETLIDSPVKKRQAEMAVTAMKVEKPAKSRIGSLPVPGEDDDDDDVATPMESTEVSDAIAGSSAKMSDDDAVGNAMDVDSDKENSSGSLSSPRSSSSRALSRASSLTRALSELPDMARGSAAASNSRKRKHRASSVGLPSKRYSMEPPQRRRAFRSEGNGVHTEQSPLPKPHSHRRTLSTQSAVLDGANGDSRDSKRRPATHLPVQDIKSRKRSWEESDASSETASHGHTDARRLQRGIGRSTSTPGRPPAQLKRHVNKYGFTRLAEACEEAELKSVKEWLDKDPGQMEVAEYAGNKPLQIAALNGNDEVVAFLIEHGCQIDCANVDKDTPLLDAAENGHLKVVRILLKAGVDPLRQNLKGQQALDVVCRGTDDIDDADEIRAALRLAIESWNSVDAKQRREKEEEYRYRAGSNKELHFMARTYENLLRLVTNNDRNSVREFLDARVPVDNVIIAAAAKTGDQYLVNMLLAEMTEKKSRQKPHKPMLAVLGTSHFEMVQLLTELEHFNPLWKSRAGKTWAEQAEEKHGPHWRQEKALFERLHSEQSQIAGRKSSSPVTKREGSKRRVTQADDDSDEPEVPKRKNGRRLMSRRDMRAANGKPLSASDSEDDTSASDTNDPDVETKPTPTEVVMKPPGSPSQKRGVGRPRTKSLSSQSADTSAAKGRRRSSSLRGALEIPLATLEEKPEEKLEEEPSSEDQRVAAAMFAVHEAQRLEAKRRETEVAEVEAKRAEEQARKAAEERQAKEAREAEARQQAEREQAMIAELAKKAAEDRKQRELEMEDARRSHVQEVLAAVPSALAHVLDPHSTFKYEEPRAISFLQQHFTPLLVVKEDSEGPWILNVQAAPLLGKRGLELLLPRSSSLEFEMSFSRDWDTADDFSIGEQANVQSVVSALASREGRRDSIVDADISMADSEDDWQTELVETAKRLNAVCAATERVFDGTLRLYCVKLVDVLAHLDPLLLGDDPIAIDVRYLTLTTRSAETVTTLDKQGIHDFWPRCTALFSDAMRFQSYTAGLLEEEETTCAGITDIVVVHEK